MLLCLSAELVANGYTMVQRVQAEALHKAQHNNHINVMKHAITRGTLSHPPQRRHREDVSVGVTTSVHRCNKENIIGKLHAKVLDHAMNSQVT